MKKKNNIECEQINGKYSTDALNVYCHSRVSLAVRALSTSVDDISLFNNEMSGCRLKASRAYDPEILWRERIPSYSQYSVHRILDSAMYFNILLGTFAGYRHCPRITANDLMPRIFSLAYPSVRASV